MISNSIKIPGRRLTLPSRGLKYVVGEEINQELIDGEVTIQPLTTKDEMMLSAVDMIISGDAIHNVIKKCVKEIEEPTKLYFNDVIAILTYLKMVTYGNKFPISFKHNCSAEEIKYEIELDELIRTNIIYFDNTLESELNIKFDDCEIVLDFPRYKDQIKLIQDSKIMYSSDSNDTAKKYEFFIENLLTHIKFIKYENEVLTEKEKIKNYVEDIPVSIMNFIYEKILQSDKLFGIDSTYNIKCPNCNEVQEVDLPLDPTLFF